MAKISNFSELSDFCGAETWLRGEYSRFLENSIEGKNRPKLSALEHAFVVVSLAFVGRQQDAETWFQENLSGSQRSGALELCLARFGLVVGLCRFSRYEEARVFLLQNLRQARSVRDPAARFFALQGIGFYRNFCCRYERSRQHADRAWKIAFRAGYRFGMLLSADLLGHNLVQLGEVSRGLKFLEDARKIAQRLENAGIAHVLEISILTYQFRYGFKRDLNQLRQALTRLKVEDIYSRSNLGIELARQLHLRGQCREAERWLAQFEGKVLASGLRRQKAMLLHARAYQAFLRGETDAGLEFIAEGISLLERKIDLLPLGELLGLKEKFSTLSPFEQRELAELTRLSRRSIAENIWRRQNLRKGLDPLDDRLADICTKVAQEGAAIAPSRVRKIMKLGTWGLLRSCLPRVEANAIFFDLVPDRVLLFSRGEISVSRLSAGPLLRQFLLLLAHGSLSKEQIVRRIWGYRYDPIRHDPLIYTLVHRTRELLGDRANWLANSEGQGYFFVEPVTVQVFEQAITQDSGLSKPEIAPTLDLNYRQLEILEWIKQNGALGVMACAEKFGIAKITAHRDLAWLAEKGFLVKRGRARATTYGRT